MLNPRGIALGFALAFNGAALAADDEKLHIQVGRLTLDTAVRIAQGAIEACRAQQVSVGVAVVDRNGIVQVQLRDTLAPPITLQISREKAYTAANFQAESGALGNLADGPIGRIDGLTMSAGGLMIEAGGQVFGAVGVSGAPSGETDAACARAGIEVVIDDLEMSI